MFFGQVIIAGLLCHKLFGAHPAEDGAASRAVHLVAATHFLHGTPAAWTRPAILAVFQHPSINSTSGFLAAAEHAARHSVVALFVARSTCVNVAFRATKHLWVILACNAVHHWTVRGGAEVSLVAIGQDVSREGRAGQIGEFEVTETRQVVEVSPSQRELTTFITADDRKAVVLYSNSHLKSHTNTSAEQRVYTCAHVHLR